jgi:hypothetical protein
MDPTDVSEKSRLAAFLLAVFTGVFGGHRFYVGKIGSGILQICTIGGLGFWWLADCVLIASGEFRDVRGKRVVRWTTDEDLALAGAQRDPRLLEDMEQMRSEVFELQERVDFLERTLTAVRERPGMPPGGR